MSKGPGPAGKLTGKEPDFVSFYFELAHLKQIYRQGWLRRGIPREECESVADHSWAVAMLAMWMVDRFFPDLDLEKILRLTILHDIGEIDAGDITPADGVSPAEKSRLERNGVERLFELVPGGERYVELWEEYEAGESQEARFVREIEKLEMALQAAAYGSGLDESPGEFLDSAGSDIKDPVLAELLGQLREALGHL